MSPLLPDEQSLLFCKQITTALTEASVLLPASMSIPQEESKVKRKVPNTDRSRHEDFAAFPDAPKQMLHRIDKNLILVKMVEITILLTEDNSVRIINSGMMHPFKSGSYQYEKTLLLRERPVFCRIPAGEIETTEAAESLQPDGTDGWARLTGGTYDEIPAQ